MLGDDYAETTSGMNQVGARIHKNFKILAETAGQIDHPEERGRMLGLIAAAQKDAFAILEDGNATMTRVKGMTDLSALNVQWRRYRDANKERGVRARATFGALTQATQGLIATGQTAPAKDLEKLTIALVIIVVVSSLAMVIGSIWVRNSIVAPMARAVAAVERITEGDLTRDIQGGNRGSQDEVAVLLGSMAAMQERLRDVLSQVRGSAETVASGSMELSASADQMAATTRSIADGTQAQEHTADRMTAAITQAVTGIAAMLQGIAVSSEEQSRTGEAVGHQVEQEAGGTHRMAQATTEQSSAVDEVTRTAHDLAQVAEALNVQTKRFQLARAS